tara:strand:+ start:1012 stop:4305 length:3294 start_codon:yes stop_codon:yes gene_type:complete
MSYSWLREYSKDNVPVTQGDLRNLENYADRLFARVGIDVEFTRHFLDRVNDERNDKQITVGELIRIFKQQYKYYGKKIAQLGPDAEAVMKDMKTDVNIPFALQWDQDSQDLDLVAKTVMRKKNFKTSNPEFAVEYTEKQKLYRDELAKYVKDPLKPGTAVVLTRLGEFHKYDPLEDYVPERKGKMYALHPDNYDATFYSLTNKDLNKIVYYGPKVTRVPAGSMIADMAIANRFYRTKDQQEREAIAKEYQASMVPFGTDVSAMKMPEVLIPTNSGKPIGLDEAKVESILENLAPASEIYVDMDGVLADFFGSWGKLLGVDSGTEFWKTIKNIEPALDKVREKNDFWINIPLTSGAKNLLNAIKQIKGKYNILSAPLPNDPNSEPQKREWIKKNLSSFPPEKIIIDHDKAKYAKQPDGTPNALIDDYGVNVQRWEAAGGVGIKHSDSNVSGTVKQLDAEVNEDFIDDLKGFIDIKAHPTRYKKAANMFHDYLKKQAPFRHGLGYYAQSFAKLFNNVNYRNLISTYLDAYGDQALVKEEDLVEAWSKKYKNSINCSNPKGFSQKAHCASKKKKEDIEEYVIMPQTIKPMGLKHKAGKGPNNRFDFINKSNNRANQPTAEDLDNCKYGKYYCSTDKKWKCRKGPKKTRESVEEAKRCWPGYEKKGTKMMFGKRVNNCVKKEELEVEGKRIPRKKGQPAGSKKHSDLYTDENPKGTIQGLKFATVKDAEASVSKIKNSGKKHAHKIQAAVAMEQRAKAAGKKSAAAVYRTYINQMKKKTKKEDIQENFADGKKPGRKGLSKKVGVSQKMTIAQLEKIAKNSTGEKRRMAQWNLNMKRGRAKKEDILDTFVEFKIVKPDARDTLGISRSQMPQVEKQDYPELIQYMKSNGAKFSKATVDAHALKPTQSEFSDVGVAKQLLKDLEGKPTKPVLISSDNWIVDGHHRWLVSKNTGSQVEVYRISLPVQHLLKLLKEFPKTHYKDIYTESRLEMMQLTTKALKLMPGSRKQAEIIVKLNKLRRQYGLEPLTVDMYHKDLHDKDKMDEAAGVGRITKQNATPDAPIGSEYENMKKLSLGKSDKLPLLHKKAAKNSDPNKLTNLGIG